MPFRQSLFWDTDVSRIDTTKNAQYIIERILDFGHDDEVRWMWHFYDRELLKKVFYKSRCLRPETRALWSLMLKNE